MAAFERAQDELFESAGLDVQSRFVELDSPRVRVHVLETGDSSDDPPLVFVHGTAAFGAFLAPLMGQFEGVRMLTFDRPGYGLSDGFVYTESNIRRTIGDVIEGVLDEMDVERADIVGHSMGGHGGILFAGSHPERVRRLFVVGSVPAFPGTHAPLPFRVLATPVLGSIVRQFQKSGAEGVYEMATAFGEGDIIQHHPSFVRALAAHEDVPKSALAGRSEFSSFISTLGWRKSLRIQESELRAVEQPTTIIWGSHDPLGTPGEVRDGIELVPDVRFEIVDAGHIPFLAHSVRCAELIAAER